MFTTILFVVLLTGLFLGLKYSRDFDAFFGSGLVVFSLLFLIHLIILSTVRYQYNSFVAQRNAFEQTLKSARESGNQFEIATISKDVALWNQELAQRKYNNSVLLIECYTDDRIEQLEPIK